MVIQAWIIAGLVAGSFVGMMLGRGSGVAGYAFWGIIGGLAGSSLTSILFVIGGAVDGANTIAAMVAFSCAVMLTMLNRVLVARPRAI